MNALRPLVAATALITCVALPALADVKVAEPKNDGDNYRGDKVRFDVDIGVMAVRLGDGAKPSEGCLAADTQLVGLGSVAVPKDNGAENRALFKVIETKEATAGCDKPLAKGTTVAVSNDVLSTMRTRQGWSFGTLMVPYKYQLKGDRSIAGGATLGGYLGYRKEVDAAAAQYIGFVGLTKVGVPVTQDGKSSVEQMAGVSYGVGVLWTIKNAFQAGLVIGADRVNKSAGYANNDKPWVSVSLGYDFYK